MSLLSLAHKLNLENSLLQLDANFHEQYNEPITMAELECALKQCRNTAPGPDSVPNALLKNLPLTHLNYLLDIYNKIWLNHDFPQEWRHANVVPIVKPGKERHIPSSYRPISLTNCACKLMERIVNSRLNWLLTNRNLLNPVQCGSRKQHSILDHLVRASTFIQNGFIQRKHTIAIFLDIKQAYDSTWHRIIMNRLTAEWQIRGHMSHFISNFLAKRSISVRCGTTLSDPTDVVNGIVQGSVLGGTLFNIAINNITDQLPNSILSCLFVDDLGIFVQNSEMEQAETIINRVLHNLEQWSFQSGLTLSSEKTKVMHFCRKRNCPTLLAPRLNNIALDIVPHHKFLGLTFDKRLTWANHIRNLRITALKSLQLLKTVSHYNWGADRATLTKLYRSLVRSRLDYGSQVYGSASKVLLQCLDPLHNEGLRIVSGAFRSSPVSSLYVELNEPSLEHRRLRLMYSYYFSIVARPAHVSYTQTTSNSYVNIYNRRPRSSKPLYVRILMASENHSLLLPPPEQPHCQNFPPWLLNKPITNTTLHFLPKSITPQNVYWEKFKRILGQYNNWTHFFTDGSKTAQGVGAAFLSETPPHTDNFHIFPLPNICSVYSAELYAIYQCLLYIREQHIHCSVIFSDSYSSVSTLEHFNFNKNLPKVIIHLVNELQRNGQQLHIVWIPSHCGIKGNEAADGAAKMAANLISAPFPLITSDDLKTYAHSVLRGAWQAFWLGPVNASNKLRSVRLMLGDWRTACRENRHEEVVMARLRIGHTRLTHGHLMAGEPPEPCDCGGEMTVEHILLGCRLHARHRVWRSRASVGDVLRDSESCTAAVLTFLNSTGLLNKI